MRKNVFLSLLISIAFMFGACSDRKPIPSEHTYLSGYYYDAYLDEREPFEGEMKENYLYYMDHHWQDYHNHSLSAGLVEDEEEDGVEDPIKKEYTEFFESINGLNLYSLPSLDKKVSNGDYIKIKIGPDIMESYPAQIPEVYDVEIVEERDDS